MASRPSGPVPNLVDNSIPLPPAAAPLHRVGSRNPQRGVGSAATIAMQRNMQKARNGTLQAPPSEEQNGNADTEPPMPYPDEPEAQTEAQAGVETTSQHDDSNPFTQPTPPAAE
jgi:hypothetical protein